MTQLCLDKIKSAKARCETYIGAWLDEALMGSTDPDEPLADDVTLTLMLAMERLSPLERAAFLLHDVFDTPLAEVAATLGRDAGGPTARIAGAQAHPGGAAALCSPGGQGDAIARAFFAAASSRDAAALSALLAQDVTIHFDGGGKVLAFRNVIRGVERVVRLFEGLRRKKVGYHPRCCAESPSMACRAVSA